MKRKVVAGSMALVILAGGLWLGALAWSRHEVQSRMAEQVADINALTGVRALNTVESDGFFSSRGTLRVIMTDSDTDTDAPAGVIDWRVAYGVLSTRFSGHGDIRMPDGKALLADELSSGDALDVDARIQHLSHDLILNARFPDAMHYQGHGMSLDLSGARIGIVDDDHGLRLEGQWSELAHESPERQVHMGETHWSMRFPTVDAEPVDADSQDRPGRVDRLDISDARLQRQGGLPLTLNNFHLEGSTHHDREELSYLLKAQLGNAAFSEQQLGSASLDAAIRRINEPAARTLLQTMARDIRQRWQGARQPSTNSAAVQAGAAAEPQLVADIEDVHDVHDIASLMSPWQEAFFAVLSSSPRLVVNQLALESPMLDQQMHLDGEVTLDGTHIATTRIEQLKTSWGRAAFKRRLDGRFTLHNAPPLLALVAGQAPDQDTLELAIRKGVFLINGEPWFLLN
ncbi:DUF945 family protein [Kushneria marisflavi]|uniref:Uncharacterized protein n=1 Tax=Kushneria marisflavi TaxID=157779 RepID=A0A240USG8_9GAMM|nr:DUF945 family protein [Kushneria marisflavi]ART63969.1 hypothetical protein B9H00_13635 [Kushneria marisflavi]RKD85692.1 uncharacterized protein DUF945 [Kushneria marisflavi]